VQARTARRRSYRRRTQAFVAGIWRREPAAGVEQVEGLMTAEQYISDMADAARVAPMMASELRKLEGAHLF
jgi:hypothetical protein